MESFQENEQRGTRRLPVQVRGRLFWQDAKGIQHVAAVRTRDVSEHGAYVEFVYGAPPIPLYRLVDLQVERAARGREDLPRAMRQPRVMSAVYRVGPARPVSGTPEGYALRLLVEPRRRQAKRDAASSDEQRVGARSIA